MIPIQTVPEALKAPLNRLVAGFVYLVSTISACWLAKGREGRKAKLRGGHAVWMSAVGWGLGELGSCAYIASSPGAFGVRWG
jgi:hypothetical protein